MSSKRILFVTGLAGAGKSTVLKVLEDLGWEAVDNFPLRLLGPLLDLPPPEGRESEHPLALGFDTRTRGFDPVRLVRRMKQLSERPDIRAETLFLDCAGVELERRYAETRRRHPLAPDRPAIDGIAQERATMEPLRRWADVVIDTTRLSVADLSQLVRERYGEAGGTTTTITLMSFGFSRGVPHNADLVFDLRFLRNPHWVPELRPMTGLDAPVADYVAADPGYGPVLGRIRDLLRDLLPRYQAEGKAYVTVAFGCTGGRHRSVAVAEQFAKWLREDGFRLSVAHRDLSARPIDALEGAPVPAPAADLAVKA